MNGGDGKDILITYSGNDKLWGEKGDDTLTVMNYAGHNHLLEDAGLEIHGGEGLDTLRLITDHDITFNGLGAHTDSVEVVDMRQPLGTHDITLNLSFRDVMLNTADSPMHIMGDAHDTLRLTTVSDSPYSGGHWVNSGTQTFPGGFIPSETVYNYVREGTTFATVVVDDPVHVVLPGTLDFLHI